MARFHARVHGRPLDEVLAKIAATPGLQTVGTSGFWVGDKPPDERPPLEALTVVIEKAISVDDAREQVEGALPEVGYSIDDPELLASKLTSDERQVLGGLLLPPEAGPANKTVARVAVRTGLSEGRVRQTLENLASFDRPLVHREEDTTIGEFWIVLVEALDELEAPPT